jgi:hypothetical protein
LLAADLLDCPGERADHRGRRHHRRPERPHDQRPDHPREPRPGRDREPRPRRRHHQERHRQVLRPGRGPPRRDRPEPGRGPDHGLLRRVLDPARRRRVRQPLHRQPPGPAGQGGDQHRRRRHGQPRQRHQRQPQQRRQLGQHRAALGRITGTLLEANITTRNGDDGIDVESPATTITANLANDNTDLGIEAVAGVTDGGGNRASGNGNPAQCVGVRCS